MTTNSEVNYLLLESEALTYLRRVWANQAMNMSAVWVVRAYIQCAIIDGTPIRSNDFLDRRAVRKYVRGFRQKSTAMSALLTLMTEQQRRATLHHDEAGPLGRRLLIEFILLPDPPAPIQALLQGGGSTSDAPTSVNALFESVGMRVSVLLRSVLGPLHQRTPSARLAEFARQTPNEWHGLVASAFDTGTLLPPTLDLPTTPEPYPGSSVAPAGSTPWNPIPMNHMIPDDLEWGSLDFDWGLSNVGLSSGAQGSGNSGAFATSAAVPTTPTSPTTPPTSPGRDPADDVLHHLEELLPHLVSVGECFRAGRATDHPMRAAACIVQQLEVILNYAEPTMGLQANAHAAMLRARMMFLQANLSVHDHLQAQRDLLELQSALYATQQFIIGTKQRNQPGKRQRDDDDDEDNEETKKPKSN